MFISLGRMLGKSKFRIGAGLRITKTNIWWMWLVLMFVLIFQMMWYVCVLSFWMIYAVCYGIYWVIKKIIQTIKGNR